LSADEHSRNNLPDTLMRWSQRNGAERKRPRSAQSFSVAKDYIASQDYDLSLNRYKEATHEDVVHIPPRQIIADIKALELDIQQHLTELERMVG
jgi:type I restriction enzyme M protein